MDSTKERLESLKYIMQQVERDFIKNQVQYTIVNEFEYLGEVMTLYGKQHNMIESTILLLEHNMNEEALILARSVFSNYFMIGYLLNDDEKHSRLRRFKRQPLISELQYWINVKKMLKGKFGKRMKDKGESIKYSVKDVNKIIGEINNKIIEAGGSSDEKLLSVIVTAEKGDERGFELYATHYAFSSRFEHSDVSSLNIYKDKLEKDEAGIKFFMNLDKTDMSLHNSVITMICIAYFESFRKISEVLLIREKQLSRNYDVQAIVNLSKAIINIHKDIENEHRNTK